MTKKEAKEIIENNKDMTNYFNGTIDINEMYDMFRYRYRFGEAETMIIISAIVNAGGKFKGKLTAQ